MRRIRVVSLLGVLGLVIAFVLWRFTHHTPGRILASGNYPQVRLGMPQAEVERLLGGPPGNYGRYPGGRTDMTMEGYLSPSGAIERVWCDDSSRFEIYFDADGRVVGNHRRAGYSQEPGEGIFEWMRRVTRY
jgi:hypothetical protein